jgi:hypothetical protein
MSRRRDDVVYLSTYYVKVPCVLIVTIAIEYKLEISPSWYHHILY